MKLSGYPSEIEATINEAKARVAELEVKLPFEPDEYADRRRRLRKAMSDDGIDILILTSPDAMCWLHGFASRWYEWHASTTFGPDRATVVHVTEDPVFFIDTSYHTDLVRHTSCVEDFRPVPVTESMDSYPSSREYLSFLVDQIKSENWPGKVVGIERYSGLPNPAVAEMQNLALREAGFTIVDATKPIRKVRRRKSDAEIAKIESAAAACDAGHLGLVQNLQAGMTELEAWSIFMSSVVAAGGEPSAIHETVSIGPPEAFTHGLSSRRVLGEGDLFHPDMSAAVNCYHARCTRPHFLGDAPPPSLVALTEILAGAHRVVEEVGKVGTTFGRLSSALAEYFESESFEDGLAFGGGYELGVSLAPDYVGEFVWGTHDVDSEEVIEPGIVTNFESVGFLTLVDTVVFETDGPRFLSNLPREFQLIAA